jgi:hypothetical protein
MAPAKKASMAKKRAGAPKGRKRVQRARKGSAAAAIKRRQSRQAAAAENAESEKA